MTKENKVFIEAAAPLTIEGIKSVCSKENKKLFESLDKKVYLKEVSDKGSVSYEVRRIVYEEDLKEALKDFFEYVSKEYDFKTASRYRFKGMMIKNFGELIDG